jgi:hypothetical protein
MASLFLPYNGDTVSVYISSMRLGMNSELTNINTAHMEVDVPQISYTEHPFLI